MRRLPRRLAAPVGTALLVLPLLLVAACASDVEITSAGLSDEERAVCEALVADLPDELFGEERAEVSGTGVGAAWGDDPTVVLTCGAPAPETFDAWARCSEIDGIGWYVPDSQMKDTDSGVAMTAQSHSPRVLLEIPAELRFNAPDTHLRTLAAVLDEHLDETQPCT